MSSELTQRNVRALHAGLKETRRQNAELLDKYDELQTQLSMVLREQATLKSQINALFAMKGIGATSGN